MWSDRALLELAEVARRRALGGPEAVSAWFEAVESAIKTIDAFPRAGRVLRGLDGESHRELLVQDHWLIYRSGSNELRIRAIIHSRRDWDPKQLTLLP